MGLRVDILEGGRIAVSSLRGNRLRTILTTVGVGIGVCTLLAIVGIIQGLNSSVARQLSSLGASTLYVSKFSWGFGGNWWEFRNRKELTWRQGQALQERLPEVDAVAAFAGRRGEVSFLGHPITVDITGTTAAFPRVAGYDVPVGRFLTDSDDENASNVVVLGADVKDTYFSTINPLGMTLRVNDRPFRVVGVLNRKGKILDQDQDNTVYVPLKTYLADFGKRWPLQLGVVLRDGVDLRQGEDAIDVALRQLRQVPPGKPDDFSINKPEQLARMYEQLTGALYGVAVGIGLITLLVGGIGIMNVMLVSVRERTREIGVRRALGARKRTIVLQFLMEAGVVSGVGGIAGTALGLCIAKLIDMTTPLAAAVQPLTIVGGVLFAAVVGLLFGIWPAARAASLDPVEALRHE